MSRGNYGYTLPEPRPKNQVKEVPAKAMADQARREHEAREKGQAPPRPLALPKPPSPMNGVKLDWEGETKDDLLAKPHPLPPSVRAHPRAYLVPPRPSSTLKNNIAYNATQTQRDGKRKRDDRAVPSPASAPIVAPIVALGPQQQFLPPIMSMPTDAFGRQATQCMWDNVNKTWTNWYADGAITTSAPYNIGIPSQPPLFASTPSAGQPLSVPPPVPAQRDIKSRWKAPSTTLSLSPNLSLPARPDWTHTSLKATTAKAQPSDSDSADNCSANKRLRVEESAPQPASSQPPRQESEAVSDQMDLDPKKAPATSGTAMPTMGAVRENDEEDELVFDDDLEFEEVDT
ncbi:hypothetical protein AA0113_g5332 [Alternaria arborescens]|uniref:Uncharacterized protein n=1 Tax=Alternaria arborescens TaxID=156630 RepID=A0A4Q4S704_9PLEO|nr:hypothetical protein AA0111_g4567 [Alternaria arborescens]RYN21316.1 hypothetical protein AA0112_g10334 [Alternaria arborescens]RYO32764.1 hypothetical protein AA0111_g4567 [Alternaria arborescens]RYO65346.1 hypothetical protein AA0113_g5332 [Alternaria arborescens]